MNELVGVLSFYRVGEKRYTCNDHMLVMFKILQARLQQYVNRELPEIQAGFIYLFIYLFFQACFRKGR